MNTTIAAEILKAVQDIAALQLWNLGAIQVDLKKPYRLTSGNYSPLYVNCRQLISSPSFVDIFCATARMLCDTANVRFDVIAGGETAGIPFASFLARGFGRPLIYVRKQVKSHGIGSRIEGVIESGAKTLLVEDLITDAGSKLSFIDAIRAEGAIVEDVLVVFDRLQGGGDALAKAGVRLHAVTDLDAALRVGQNIRFLSDEEIEAVREYLREPGRWHKDRSLPFKESFNE